MKQFIPLLAGLLLHAAIPSHAHAITVSFTLIADESSAIPGGSGTFTQMSPRLPGLSGNTAAFNGLGLGQDGVYTGDGGAPSVVADLTTAIPGGTGNFTDFTAPGVSGTTTVFRGEGAAQMGIYSNASGSLGVIADRTTTLPGSASTFVNFDSIGAVSGSAVAFFATGSGGEIGVYSNSGGSLNAVADTATAIPGGTGNFTSFSGGVGISGYNVAFDGGGSSSQRGIYASLAGSLGVVADRTTAIPGGSGNFSAFFSPSISGNAVAFTGLGGSGQEGIYSTGSGALARIADKSTAIPEGTGLFTDFANFASISGTSVAFEGSGDFSQNGIYYSEDGTSVEKIVDTGDVLDGRTVAFVDIGPHALDGNRLTFWTRFDDGTDAIYLATIPEPSRAMLALVGLGAALARRRNSRLRS